MAPTTLLATLILARDDLSQFKFYHYDPSLAAAAIFFLLFLALTIYHTYKLFPTRTWSFIPFVIGGFFETIGYIGRIASARQSPDWTLTPYMVQSLLLLLAPALFAASVYMVFGRLIRLLGGERYSLIRVNWLTKIFVAGDVLSFLVQSGGGGMLASASDASGQDLGNNMIIGGLIIQVLFFGLFIVACAVFHKRMLASGYSGATAVTHSWQQYMLVLYVASGLIFVRSVFRVAEYAGGQDGVLLSHEWFLYVFDALLMWVLMVLFAVRHPGEIIGRKTMGYGMANLS